MPPILTAIPRKLDDFLIDRVFQPICDRLARWIDCYGIAEFVATGAVAVILLYTGLTLVYGYPWIATFGMVLAGIYAIRIRIIRTMSKPQPGLMPKERLTGLTIRTLDLAFCIFLMLPPAWPAPAWWLYTASMYFTACRKLPPRHQRAASWLSRYRRHA